MKLTCQRILIAIVTFLGALTTHAQTLETELLAIQQDWATANYETSAGPARVAAFDALAKRAEALTGAHPGRAEPLIWEGIVLSTYAGAKGGLGALSLAKRARDRLEAAKAIDADALDGSVYTSLGSLYAKVPGFPLGFGDDRKARGYLEQALKINPQGIDPNYFYGEFLYEHGDPTTAIAHLRAALQAPARPGRESADAGRRQEIEVLIRKIEAQQS